MSGSDRGSGAAHLKIWAYIAGIAICAAVGLTATSEAIKSQRYDNQSAKYTQSAKDHAQRSCVGVDPGAVFECAYDHVERAREDNRAEQDVDAQQDMVLWARLMFFASFAATLITAVGVWLVKGTLDATLVAVKSTTDATDQMFEANKIARELMERQLRAYIGLEHAAFGRVGNSLVFKITIKNTGQTPAKSYKGICSPYFSHASRVRYPENLTPYFRLEGTTVVGAGGTAEIKGELLKTPEEWHEFEIGALRVYAMAFVSYRDVFETKRETIISLESNFPIDGTFRPFNDWSAQT